MAGVVLDWQPIAVAKLWPIGSVVLSRRVLRESSVFSYSLFAYWKGDNFFDENDSFVLIESAIMQDN